MACDMKYIIMCGGHYDGWNKPRQLLDIKGEPIVMRTIRLLRAAGADDIAISTDDGRFEECGVPLLKHRNDFKQSGSQFDGLWTDAFYPSPDPACYIFGDVAFSPDAIQTIVSTKTKGIEFFASAPPFDERYIKSYAEPFAFKVVNQRRFRAAIEMVKEHEKAGLFNRPPIAWELWQVIIGLDINDIDYGSYIQINDYTCDIDSYNDAEKMNEVLMREG